MGLGRTDDESSRGNRGMWQCIPWRPELAASLVLPFQQLTSFGWRTKGVDKIIISRFLHFICYVYPPVFFHFFLEPFLTQQFDGKFFQPFRGCPSLALYLFPVLGLRHLIAGFCDTGKRHCKDSHDHKTAKQKRDHASCPEWCVCFHWECPLIAMLWLCL